MLTNIALETAWEAIGKIVLPLETEKVPLAAARGRVAAVDLLATRDLPASPRAAMDGYALRSGDLGRVDRYQVVVSYGQGSVPGVPLESGQAAQVVTGGPLPPGDVTMVPWEKVKLEGDQLTLPVPVSPGSNIRPPGEDFGQGDLLAPRGWRLDPGLVGVLAALGQSQVEVLRRPRVAIISLGPEVVSHDTTPAPGQGWDSNGPLLAALVEQDRGQVTCLKTTGAENVKDLPGLLTQLLAEADLLLTIGGTATGAGDNALDILKQMQAEIIFWGVRIKPGSHTGVALWENKPVVTLSGNPAACAVGYHLLATPMLRAMQAQPLLPPRYQAVFQGTFAKKSGTRRFLRGRAFCGLHGWEVELRPGQKSSMMRSLIGCNALIDLPAGHQPLAPGDTVDIIPLSPV